MRSQDADGYLGLGVFETKKQTLLLLCSWVCVQAKVERLPGRLSLILAASWSLVWPLEWSTPTPSQSWRTARRETLPLSEEWLRVWHVCSSTIIAPSARIPSAPQMNSCVLGVSSSLFLLLWSGRCFAFRCIGNSSTCLCDAGSWLQEIISVANSEGWGYNMGRRDAEGS